MVERVLVIEDVQSDAFRVQSILLRNVTGKAYDVTVCRDSKSAFRELVGGEPYDAVVSDYILPDCDGIKLMRMVHKTLGDATPPFLLLSGMARHVEEEARIAGAVRVLDKPARPQQLLEALAEMLAGRRAA